MSSYFVKTEDGYILKLFRIAGPKNSLGKESDVDPKRRVVLLQHGLLDSSDSWVVNYESKSLAFILANKGYDVWLGNSRGNKYSRIHEKLNPDKNFRFWSYSFHEMGKYDLPAMIEFIRKKTGKEKISYIGHSQGTSQMFSALTYNTEFFSSRLDSFIALGPVTNLEHVASGFIKTISDYKIDLLLMARSYDEMFSSPASLETFQGSLCNILTFFCKNILNMIADSDPTYIDMDRFIVWISHYPSGTSLQSIQHFSESIRSKTFAPFEPGSIPYELKNIKNIPIGLFVGKNDLLATVEDNRILKAILEPNNVVKFYKEYEDFGHSSFFLSKENPHIYDLLNFLDVHSQ